MQMGITALAICMTVASYAGIFGAYEKAGIPGWKALVPVYNKLLFLRIIGKPYWWLFLLIIPLVNIVVGALMAVEFALCFHRGELFGVGADSVRSAC